MASKTPPEKETLSVRVPKKLYFEINRLSQEKGLSRNQMCAELLDLGVAYSQDMTPVLDAIENSKGFFDELKIDKLAENIKNLEMTFYQKAWLAYKLKIEQRTELFKKLGYNTENDEAYTIDMVLHKSWDKKNASHNIHMIANSLTYKLSDFGQEYLASYIGEKGIEKLRSIKPEILPDLDVDVDLSDGVEIDDIPFLEEEEP